MNCHECKHRGEVVGSVHSSCRHPDIPEYDPVDRLLVLAKRVTAVDSVTAQKFGITVNEHGLLNGWANWPLDFDHIWISGCERFEEKHHQAGFTYE